MQTTEVARIDSPAEEVWRTLADFGRISEWAPDLDHSCLATEAATGPGVTRRVQAGRTVLLEHVLIWEPGERLGYCIEGLPRAVRQAETTWVLERSGDRTVVKVVNQLDAGSRPAQRLLARLLGRAMARASRRMLGGLKVHLEGCVT